MGGKSSGNGASFANRASRDLVGTGSMTSRSPSFRMMASSPGNSNSRGIRTALFRPFLKTLTWRSEPVLARLSGICQAYANGVHLSTSPEKLDRWPRFGSGVCELTLRLRSGQALGYVQISLHFPGLSALNVVMPTDLRRFQQSGQSHFVTFTCYHPLAKGELTSTFRMSAIDLFGAWRVCAAASPCASTDTLSCRNISPPA